MNKYLISVDIEGITGVMSREFSSSSGKFYSLAQRYMASDVNAVINGILQGDPDHPWIVVRDAHGRATNLDLERLHSDASVIQGWGHHVDMVASLDETYAGVFFVGYHAGGQNSNAVLAHTAASSIHWVKVNGMMINETGINALIAGYYKVPVAFISGDDGAVYEAEQQLGKGNIIGVEVKKSLARDSALSLSLIQAQRLLENGACEATRRLLAKKFTPFVVNLPLMMEIKFYNIGYLVSVYAKIKGALSFDNAYAFDDENFIISYSAKTQLEACQRLDLIVKLVYAA